MKIRTQKILLSLFLVSIMMLPLLSVQAQESTGLMGEIGNKLGLVNNKAQLPNSDTDGFVRTIGSIIKTALLFTGTIFLVLFIYAGFLWMTAGGNSDQVKKATSMMRNAVIGLIIIFLSYSISVFVFRMLAETQAAG